MEVNHTKKSTRIIIWVIAIVMAGGFVGSYFLLILENDQAAKKQTAPTTNQTENTTVDPTAYKVAGKVDQLQVTDLVVGTGAEVKAGDSVTAHYKGTIAQTGVKFDSSYDRGEPATFSLSQVIPGWQQGVPGMKVGGKRRLVIPSNLAYGSQAQSTIPANSDLVFEIELLSIGAAPAPTAQ
jgi:FKBP-type peptidyl-prolyl cis-trans isomerase